MRRLQNNQSRFPSGMREKLLERWLAEARKEEMAAAKAEVGRRV